MIKVTTDETKVNAEIDNRLIEALEDACQMIANEAKKNLYNSTKGDGILAASIGTEISVPLMLGKVGSNLEHALYVHEGTGIYAKSGNGKQEPWFWPVTDEGTLNKKYGIPMVYVKNGMKFYKSSGQKPNPFLRDAADDNLQNIINIFRGAF